MLCNVCIFIGIFVCHYNINPHWNFQFQHSDSFTRVKLNFIYDYQGNTFFDCYKLENDQTIEYDIIAKARWLILYSILAQRQLVKLNFFYFNAFFVYVFLYDLDVTVVEHRPNITICLVWSFVEPTKQRKIWG